MFPESNSTVKVKELGKIFKYLDTNKDKKIERNELHNLFMENKNFLAQPFLSKLRTSLLKLDQLTTHPIQFSRDQFTYYVSSLDQVKTHNESTNFCKYWGGQLLVLSSEKELKYSEKVMNAHGNKNTYWYGKDDEKLDFAYAPETMSKINGSIYSDCKEFNPFQDKKTVLKWAATCEKKNQFICRKMSPLEKYNGPQAVLETAFQHTYNNKTSSIIIICVVIVVVLLAVAVIVCKCCVKSSQPVAVTKLPTQTPIQSDRKSELGDSDGKNNKFALIPAATPTSTLHDIDVTNT